MEIRALTQSEQKYTYAQSMQLEGQTGCIGHLRGDFGGSGNEFHTDWSDCYSLVYLNQNPQFFSKLNKVWDILI